MTTVTPPDFIRDPVVPTVNEVAALGVQLPMLVRGFYYEGWKPADKPLRERKKETFLTHISEARWR